MRTKIFLIPLLCLSLASAACGCSDKDRTPDFEALGVEWLSAGEYAASGLALKYETATEKEPERSSEAYVTAEYGPCEAPAGQATPQGFGWRKLSLAMSYGDEACNESGYSYRWFMTDYYDVKAFRDSMVYEQDLQCETFSLRFNGKKYRCRALISRSATDWSMDESGVQRCTETLTWTLMLPEGYDGLCCGLIDSALEEEAEAAYLFTEFYAPEDFLIYRLD